MRIEVEGEANRLDQFLADLKTEPPPLARIDDLIWEPRPSRGDGEFRIEESTIDTGGPIVISPDAATCDACLAELFDSSDRRYRYPFLNCTHCGPRLTIVLGAPYDRERTTMVGFVMCAACRAEYEDPADRRFHAQPIACPACGPCLTSRDGKGRPVQAADPVRWFAEAIRDGRIGAMKGLGGYHLVCDAYNPVAVAELRRRKHREEKAFALMVRDLPAAEELCEISAAEQKLLTSRTRPIVLLARRASHAVDGVAPGNPLLGLMLPYTPLHHLLLSELDGLPLVMSSGNRSDEPIAFEEPDVFERLNGIADVFLTHDRPIHLRCDDSVTRVIGGFESPLRRSRGYAPQPIRLTVECPEVILAVGGQLKGTFGFGRGKQAILSHHLGDLDHFEAFRAFEKDVALYERLFKLRPRWIAHDLHPDYTSTAYARSRAAAEGISLLPIQHHQAHVASCMTEHGLDGPVIGVSFDGTGYGTDGRIWGGEFFVGDMSSFQRMAHLRYVQLPGGDRAVREPWRMALAHLADAGASCAEFRRRLDTVAMRVVERMLERRFNAPLTSSAGRLFDAVASLMGVRDVVSFEGQAAIQLEWLASQATDEHGEYPFEFEPQSPETSDPLLIDTRPLIRAIARDVTEGIAPPTIARRFHNTVAAIVVAVCCRIGEAMGVRNVVLSGGVFMNALLGTEVERRLKIAKYSVFRQKLVPCNDGGISLGQLAMAARHINSVHPIQEVSCAWEFLAR